MRLIDADQFGVIALQGKSEEFIEGVLFILDKIYEAPTVEERPHGEWKKTTHAIACSNCGHNIEHRLFGAYMRYCCVCGSDNWREGEAREE